MGTKDKFKFAIYKIQEETDIIEKLVEYLKAKGYEDAPCYDHNQILMVYKGEPEPPSWINFLKHITSDRSALKIKKINPCFVLLNRIENKCYAITGGSGHHHINQFIEEDFGLDAISRILEADRIKLIRQTAFAGKILQLERIFKEFYNYNFDTSNWGKLTKEILGQIDNKLLNALFDLRGGKTRSIKLAGKSSFWISRGVTHEELNSVLKKLHSVSHIEPKIPLFSGYRCIDDEALKKVLVERLLDELSMQFEAYLDNPDSYTETNLHISYTDAKELILCDKYSINFPGKEPEVVDTLDLSAIFSALQKNQHTEFKKHFLSQISIVGLNDKDIERDISGGLKRFIYAEISLEDENYYFVDGKWYQLTDEFQKDIDKRAKAIIDNCSDPSFSLPDWRGWTSTNKEPDYINEICASPNFVKMHNDHIRIGTGNDKAEMCDAVFFKEGVHLVFIKRGTGSSLRELFAQVRTSVELYKRENKFQKDAIAKVLKKSRYPKTGKFSFTDFSVVLAIIDKSINQSHKPLGSKLSILAKLDLINCVNYIKSDLEIKRVLIHEVTRKKSAQPSK
jgi:uncharacterized protein (TIGR04141 family)